MSDSRVYKVLYAEDSDEDRFLFEHSLIKYKSRLQIIARPEEGRTVIDYLSGKSPFDDRAQYPLPDLIILDLKMPGTNGMDVLSWLHRTRMLDHLPVVVLSASASPKDVQQVYQLGADIYLVKSSDGEDQQMNIRRIESYADTWYSAKGPYARAKSGLPR